MHPVTIAKTLFCSALLSLTCTLSAAPAQQPTPNPFVTNPANTLLNKLSRSAPAANPEVISYALSAMSCALASGMAPAHRLAVIDYSLPSTKPRLWVFDLASGKLLFKELVAHGRNTGENYAQVFSNIEGSRQSSIGLFRTKNTYQGSNGYSMRLDGLESGFNDRAMERAIVMHGAKYVSNSFLQKYGRLGRSWGCPAVSAGVAKRVIDAIKGEQFLFSYYPDQHWLTASKFLNCPNKKYMAQLPFDTPELTAALN